MKKNIITKKNIIPDFLKGTFEEYKLYTKYYAKSFYFSSFALPKEKRLASYAIYALCRYADNLTDHSAIDNTAEVNKNINDLLLLINEIYKNENIKSAFALTVRKYNIPEKYFLELIEGVSSDLRKKSYKTFDELESYCYKVASVVGLMMTKIFGSVTLSPEPYAIALGKAMQLTNILRDIKEDYNMGRIYIAEEDLNACNYTLSDIKNEVVNDNFRKLMKIYIERARYYYKITDIGIELLQNDGSRATVKMMSKIYSGILNEIENNNYDIYSRRLYVSTYKKILYTLHIFLSKFVMKFRKIKPSEPLPETT